jgi:bacteriocin-like protein
VQNIENMDQTEIELTDAELAAINGGGILSAIGHAASWVAHKVKDALGDGARF